jgi:hypothetical protein
MSALDNSKDRTYGNLVKPRSPGIWGLGLLPSMLAVVTIIVIAAMMTLVGVLEGLVAMALAAPVFLVLLKPGADGRTQMAKIGERWGGILARRSGTNLYHSGPTGFVPYGSHLLPGVLAPTQLSEAEDAFGVRFAVLCHPWVRQLTVIIETEPDGASLADQWQIDQWVGHHGDWLARLSREPGLLYAQVSIESAPDPGTRLSHMLGTRRDVNAPAFAQEVLNEIEQTYPSGSAELRARIALTYSMSGPDGAKLTAGQKAHDIALRLHHLVTELSNTGAGVAKAVDRQRMCEIVLSAYNPAKAVLLERARAAGEPAELEWEDVGPAQAIADAKRGAYWHDGCISRTWEMTEAPRGHFREGVLAELLAPNAYVPRKRVTLLYRVLPPAEAAAVIERDVHNAAFRVDLERRAAPRLRNQAIAAEQSSNEEARGAAVLMMGMLITATVMEEDGFGAMNAAVENAAPVAKIALRLPRAGQDALFAAALPCGVWLPDHLKIPQAMREAL